MIGYVLAIGDIGHNDPIARTRGVRNALGTAVEKDGATDSSPVGTNVDGTATTVMTAPSRSTASPTPCVSWPLRR